MKNRAGHSLTELLVSLVVASILILMIGVISNIANSSYSKVYKAQEMYNDISYAFKLVRNKVHGSGGNIAVGDKSSPWISGQHFLIDSGVFGLQANGNIKSLVYNDGVKSETIFSVPQPGTVDLTLSGLPGDYVRMILSGKKDNMVFNMETAVLRRNQ